MPEHDEPSDYFVIYLSRLVSARRRAHTGGPFLQRTVPQTVAVTGIGVAMRWGTWWRLLD